MRRVYFGHDNIITSLGFTTGENAGRIRDGISGIRSCEDPAISLYPVAFSPVPDEELEKRFNEVRLKYGSHWSSLQFYRLEKMFIVSIAAALENSSVDPRDSRTLMIFSTTKGNIDLLASNSEGPYGPARINLWELAGHISMCFQNPNPPLVISNACTSGSVAIITAARLISSGLYDRAIVTGGDIITEFVISGFQSFQALSPVACRPFDADRTGLSLGEGCGTVLLTSSEPDPGNGKPVAYLGGATSNDANHISGPSRDGEGLYLAVSAAMNEAGILPGELDYISAHGTATPYNDEMESLALAWAGLENIPVNSFKGYFGHTLGAAGIIETILTAWSIRHDELFRSLGYEHNGVSRPLNIITRASRAKVRKALKTASGFGGCNAAIVIGNSKLQAPNNK